jgi:tetratricopeptide (TPR) repeat protein
VLVVAFTGSVIGGIVWWQDRPLREVSRLLSREEFRRSLALSDRFLARHPDDSRAMILKARALSGLDRHSAADSLFEQVALQSNGFPDDLEALRAWATSLQHLKRWPRAISILETLSNLAPADADTLHRLTVARIHLKRYVPALDSASRLATISGHEDDANVMIAAIHHDKGDLRAALEAWERVLEHNPNAENLRVPPAEALLMVGDNLLRSGNPQRAVDALERSLRQSPSARAYVLLGQAYSQTDRPEDAIRTWQSALAIEDLNATAREELANAAIGKGKFQAAVDWMLPLTTADNLAGSSAFVLQRAYTGLQKPEEAARWRERASALREVEQLRITIQELIQNSSDPFWVGYLRAYQLAMDQNWEEAEVLIADLLLQRSEEPHLRSLAEAVRSRGELPSVDHLINERIEGDQ